MLRSSRRKLTDMPRAPPLGELAGASPTERARPLTTNPRHSDSIALTKSLPIAAQRLSGDGLALSVTFGDTSPKGRGFGSPRKVNGFARGSPTRGAVERSETERLYEDRACPSLRSGSLVPGLPSPSLLRNATSPKGRGFDRRKNHSIVICSPSSSARTSAPVAGRLRTR